jgi:hypothetical protein
MISVFPIVEGHGDSIAVPILLRRIASELLGHHALNCLPPFRLPRNKLQFADEVSRVLALGDSKLKQAGPAGFILLIMDADTDCPVVQLQQLQQRHRKQLEVASTSIVFAVQEFEAWFLAANMNETHHALLRSNPVHVDDPEAVRDAKRRFRDDVMQPGRSYSETIDQPRFVAKMNLKIARARSASFDKLVRELDRHLTI